MNKLGRPAIKYPYLWEMYFIQWEKGAITQKNMMDWLGLKKTTLYNLSSKYKKEVYKNQQKVKKVINYKQLLLEYIEEHEELISDVFQFHINHKELKKKLKISSPTILKILNDLEKEEKIHKESRGVWKMDH